LKYDREKLISDLLKIILKMQEKKQAKHPMDENIIYHDSL
jgi:hypothetical protein